MEAKDLVFDFEVVVVVDGEGGEAEGVKDFIFAFGENEGGQAFVFGFGEFTLDKLDEGMGLGLSVLGLEGEEEAEGEEAN